MVPHNWHDDGATLTAPNGFRVTGKFRRYVLENSWDSTNYPLENEHEVNPLETSNPKLGGGSQQVFRWTVLEWTQQQGVFEMWTGQELLALRALSKQLYTKIQQLQQQLASTPKSDPLAEQAKAALIALKPLVNKL